MRRLRVVRVYKNLDAGGGIQTRLLELLPRLAEHVDLRVLCYRKRGSRAAELEEAGIPVDVIPTGSKWTPRNVRRYVRYFRDQAPDVVHTHEYTANTLMIHAAWKAGVPVRIRHIHTMAPWGWGGAIRTRLRVLADRKAAKKARVTLAVSDAVRRVFLAATGLPPEMCKVLYNGIDLTPYADARAGGEAFRVEWGIPSGTPLVGIVGRLSRGKGHEHFLRAARKITDENPEARFLVVGDGGRRPHLEALAADLGLGDRVIFTGHLDNVAPALGAMDVFLFTSLPEHDGRIQDGLPGVVIEALAAGVPVVAFDLPMVVEIMGRGPCGVRVPDGDVDALVREVCSFLQDSQALVSAREDALSRATRFDVRTTADETLKLYEQLVSGGGV
ncbi:glycosyltransferase [Deferrisoma sp.]